MAITVKETVRRMLIHYPMLFRDKSDCYDHLFLTIGNGYEWIDGCLVDPHDNSNDDQPHWSDESGASKDEVRWSPELEELMRPMRIFYAKRENHQIRFALEHIDGIMSEVLFFASPYPACEYSKLFNMPSDVKLDWRQACNETSRALAMWLYNQRRSPMPLDDIESRNRAFRQQYFAAEDTRMVDIAKQVLGEKS